MSPIKKLASPRKFTSIKIRYIFLFLVFFSSPLKAAEIDQNAINQQDWITRNQQNILEEKKRDIEFSTIKKERERKKKEEELKKDLV